MLNILTYKCFKITNFHLFHRNFFVIIGKLISIANFYVYDMITKKKLACYKSRNSKKKICYFWPKCQPKVLYMNVFVIICY